MFLLKWDSHLQKLSSILGALLQEFGVRVTRPRSVTCVHKPWHLEWNTPGSPGRYAGIFGGLLSKHRRYQAFTFFEAESGIRSQVESKAGKMRNGPNRKLNCLTKKKNPHTLFHHYLGWLMRCKVCIRYELSYKNNVASEIQSAVRYFRPNESDLYKLCTNINQPYLIWAAVRDLSSCSSNKGPIIIGKNNPQRIQ